MSAHSTVVGGSSAKRFIECTGHVPLKKLAPQGRNSSVYAFLGTALHYVMEDALNTGTNVRDYLGTVIDDPDELDSDGEPMIVTIDQELMDTKLIPAYDWLFNVLKPEAFWPEAKVEMGGVLQGAFGTVDLLYVKGDRVGMVDWKFGDGVMVSAADNYQLKFYLEAALQTEKYKGVFQGRQREFDAYIVQPVAGREDFVGHAVFGMDELNTFAHKLREAKKAVDRGDTELHIGDWCKFCPAYDICPAQRNRGKEIVAALPLTETVDLPDGSSIESEVDYSGEELRTAYLEAVEVGKWVDAVKARVKDEFKSGRLVPGLKRVLHSEQRAFAKSENSVKAMLRKRGLTAKEYQATKLLSVAQLETLLKKAEAEPIPEDYIKKIRPSYQIVDESDPRDGVDTAHQGQAIAAALPSAN